MNIRDKKICRAKYYALVREHDMVQCAEVDNEEDEHALETQALRATATGKDGPRTSLAQGTTSGMAAEHRPLVNNDDD